MANRVRAVFFDLGGTLFSYRELSEASLEVMRGAARRLGLGEDVAALGHAMAQASRSVGEDFERRDYYLHRDLFMGIYRDLARRVGADPGDDFYHWFYGAQRDALVARVSPREDCHDTLANLQQRGLSLSIVSNIDDDYLDPLMKSLGLLPFFEHTSSSEEAGSCKPHRAIFEYALGKAGFSASEVVFVGDSRHHDIGGARAVGMTSVLIQEASGRSPFDRGEAVPDYTIDSLTELLRVLDGVS